MTMQSRDWQVRINRVQPKSYEIEVTGEVYVGNPGIQVYLTKKEPQGFNPNILMLDINLHQKPGVFIQRMTWKLAEFVQDITPDDPKYKAVEILMDNERIAFIEIEEKPIEYTINKPKIKISRVVTLESDPPQCRLDFHTSVYWEGHSFATEVKRDGTTINIFVTLNVPEPGPREGGQIDGFANLGVLNPGIYDINFYLRKTGYIAESHDYIRDATVGLVAHVQKSGVSA